MTIILLLPSGIGAEAGNQTGDIVVYCTNDIHGAVAFSDGGSIGLDRVAAMKEQTENAILVDAGDATQGLPFASEIEAAKREIDELTAEGADAIIAIAHLGEYDNVPCDSAALALAMDGAYSGRLDAIIDGHSHTIESESVNDIYIIQTGTGLVNLGKLTLRFGDDDILDGVEGELLSHEDVVGMVEPDPEVAAEIEGITAGMMELLRVPVA